MGDPQQGEVPCLDCKTPCRSPVSRARRIGSGCWRKRRAKARAERTPVALPGLGRTGAAGQSGPDLLADVDQLADPAEDGQP